MGNAIARQPALSRCSVHPHGCGERDRFVRVKYCSGGSSPRVWGTLSVWMISAELRRFIPTGVGNAKTWHLRSLIIAVHPHGCGERIIPFVRFIEVNGSSPRVWGTPYAPFPIFQSGRFIPTGVGNAPGRLIFFYFLTVHPHGCGERKNWPLPPILPSGSSPRVWGTLSTARGFLCLFRFIPTGVGNAPVREGMMNGQTVHPHGCGERRCFTMKILQMFGSSPRVWGTLTVSMSCAYRWRFIPTGVGNALECLICLI